MNWLSGFVLGFICACAVCGIVREGHSMRIRALLESLMRKMIDESDQYARAVAFREALLDIEKLLCKKGLAEVGHGTP